MLTSFLNVAIDALSAKLRSASADMSRFDTDEVFELAVVLSELRKIWEREVGV